MGADNPRTMNRSWWLLSGGFLLLVIAFWQCQSEAEFPPLEQEDGLDFMPMEIGCTWIYRVDSVIYDPLGSSQPIDTVSGYLKEVITDTFSTPAGLTYVLDRYGRQDSLSPWAYQKTIGLSLDNDRYLWNEDNLILVKCVFPLYNGSSWDGTAFFDPLTTIPIYGESMQPFKSWDFRLLARGESHEIGPYNWPDVMRIQQADDENLIERRYSQEWYQRGIGLVRRHMMILDTQCDGNPSACAGIPWEEKGEKGYILDQWLVEYIK